MTTFWEEFGESGGLYQMGPQKQRLEILSTLENYGISSILDVGCGTGPIYELIRDKQLPYKYKGVDYSSSFIKTCEKEFPAGNWEVQDARKLKEKDNSWDAVVILHTLDHINEYEKALKEAKRVARDIVIVVLWRPFVESDSTNINSKNQDYEDSHLVDFNKNDLDAAIYNAGLVVVNEREVDNGGKYNYMYVMEAK